MGAAHKGTSAAFGQRGRSKLLIYKIGNSGGLLLRFPINGKVDIVVFEQGGQDHSVSAVDLIGRDHLLQIGCVSLPTQICGQTLQKVLSGNQFIAALDGSTPRNGQLIGQLFRGNVHGIHIHKNRLLQISAHRLHLLLALQHALHGSHLLLRKLLSDLLGRLLRMDGVAIPVAHIAQQVNNDAKHQRDDQNQYPAFFDALPYILEIQSALFFVHFSVHRITFALLYLCLARFTGSLFLKYRQYARWHTRHHRDCWHGSCCDKHLDRPAGA